MSKIKVRISPPELFTVEQAARSLSIGRSAVFELIRRGELHSITIGRSRRIPRTAIHEFIARRAS